jgi:cobalt-zinc-cadmium efflux system membrane fusion protein
MKLSLIRAPAVFAPILLSACLGACTQKPAAAIHAASTSSEAGTVIVQPQSVTAHYPAYGQVEPIALLPVRAVEAGMVSTMRVVPGSRVRAGEALATLTGPEIQSLLTSREGALHSARAQLAAAERSLAIERQQLGAQLSTEQAVASAQSAVAAARAAFETARAQLQTAQEMSTLRAPEAGTVLAVNAAEGERVMAAQPVLTLQTKNGLRLRAVYYGLGAIHVGMTGQFEPAVGGSPALVKVAAVAAALGPDGGESVGLVPADPARLPASASQAWTSGERGTVKLNGATRSLIAVPTRALVLDRARWWVLVRSSKGLQRQAVVPGPTRGWETFIERGLSPGEQVVVQNAYLEFHRGISQRYTPPD